MENLANRTIREITLELPAATRVFEDFRIDYCCSGSRLFLEACRQAGAAPEIVLERIGAISNSSDAAEADWLKTASASALIDFILNKHHVYTRDEIQKLVPLMEKVALVHGRHRPELAALEKTLQILCEDLTTHLLKEEIILFPYIRGLEESLSKTLRPEPPIFGTVRNPVRMMNLEHDRADELLRKLREISKDYLLPDDACPSYTVLFARLEILEHDLHQHIHLENNLLFPKAVDLEAGFFFT